MENNELRFRWIHLDFHTSGDIEDIGGAFDGEAFAKRLEKSHVNSITCFARCHHGYLYYESEKFPERVHPHLKNKNLLKEQIEACHSRDIRVPIYITVQWDHYSAVHHPEWLAIKGDGAINGQKPLDPGFYSVLCVNSPYRQFLKEHTKEVLDTFPTDGIFFDIVRPEECCCKHCKEKMLKQGYDPVKYEDRMAFAAETINEFKLDMSQFIRQYNTECSIFYNASHVGPAKRPTIDAYSHFELESLPSGGWGYMNFPVTMRYARKLGLDCLAHTGKFHTSWGDFHSLKNQAALEYECFQMLTLGSKCLIGDQLEPDGVLTESAYDLIGKVYEEVEKKEPWCDNIKPITEIGILTPEEFVGGTKGHLPHASMGITRMLQESGYQFDFIDSSMDFSDYKVIVLPDNIPVSETLNAKLNNYTHSGGAVIASFESGLNSDRDSFAYDGLGVALKKEQVETVYGELARGKYYPRNDYADYILPEGAIAENLVETEYTMYIKGVAIETKPETETLAHVVEPYFYRTYQHFCSHRQAPPAKEKSYPGITKNGQVIYFSHPIFTQYYQNAPVWCKVLFVNALKMLLPDPVITYQGPSTLNVTVNEQTEKNRWVVHYLHYIPERRGEDFDVVEDIIPLYEVSTQVRVPRKVKSVQCVPDMSAIDFEQDDQQLTFKVPKVNGHQMIEIMF